MLCSPLAVMEELDIPPSAEEFSKAIDTLTCGKARQNDGISSEVTKVAKASTLPIHLDELLLKCWDEGMVPQDMHNYNIVTLYKNKGDHSDCNSYRGISLLSIVEKAYAQVALDRLQSLAERVYPEAQCGFREGRSAIDTNFLLRQLQEKCREQRQPLYIAFVNLTKVFDLVGRNGLFTRLQRIGCPSKLLKIIMSFHEDMKGTVQHDGSSVKQGCVLAPKLQIFFFLLLFFAFNRS